MADLIDRAPMLEFLDLQHYDKDMLVSQYSPDWIYSWLESQTAVDAVEVVRCKDCMWYGKEDDCPLLSLTSYTDPDQYCSYGERRTDATD